MKRVHSLLLAALVIAGVAVTASHPASATPITYTFSGIATGSLGGNNFNDASFSFAVVTDTDQVMEPDPGNFTTPGISNVAFTVDGTNGTLQFPVAFQGSSVDNFATLVDFTDPDNPFSLFSVSDFAFSSYDFVSPFGPITNSGDLPSGISSQPTSAGALTFNNLSSITFQASAAVVPESSSLTLTMTALALPALGMIGTSLVRRRRKYAMENCVRNC